MRIAVLVFLILLSSPVAWSQTGQGAQMPNVQTVGRATIWRVSDKTDQEGRSTPPWKEVTVTNVFGFKQRPLVGQKVTIVPLDVDLAILSLSISKTRRGSDCDGKPGSGWWEVDLERIKLKTYFDISASSKRSQEYPFDVAVIYPAVKFARQLKPDELKDGVLPQGVALETIKAAIDLTNDGVPDALIVEYCCSAPAKAAEGCDYNCGKTFRKIGGRWKLVDTFSPC